MNSSFIARDFADNVRTCRTKVFVTPGSATFMVARFPAKVLIKDIWLDIHTAYDNMSTGQLTVGYIYNGVTDADAFFDAVGADATATGMKRASMGGAAHAAGMRFDVSGGLITATLAKGTSVTDISCTLYTDYVVIY